MRPGSSAAEDVRSYDLPVVGELFAELLTSAPFEDVGKGRQGAVLVRPDATGGVPIVRTTTRYGGPAQCFRPVHLELARRIQEIAGLPIGFNNALIEAYTNAYATMGSHSDQALDLVAGSSIAVFSCYEHPERAHPGRVLIVEPKEPGGAPDTVPMAHHSVIVFSVAANRRLKHKIVLDPAARAAENRWLGVTFRTSRTLVHYRDGVAHLADGSVLVSADDAQRSEFYGLRRRENTEPDFDYPRIGYTVSASDLLAPLTAT